MKKIILAISILAAMACARVEYYINTPVYIEASIELTDYFDGLWYSCDAVTTDDKGRVIKETTPYYVKTITYNDMLRSKKIRIENGNDVHEIEVYEIDADGRHEMRKISFHNGAIRSWGPTVTLDEKGCPLALYDKHNGEIIREFNNDSLCHPQNDNFKGEQTRYAYDEKGRLMSLMMRYHADSDMCEEYFNEDGDLIRSAESQTNELYSYVKDEKGRIVKIRKHIFYTDKAHKKYAHTHKTIEEYFKYFVKGNTTYKCRVTENGSPADRSYETFIFNANKRIEWNNGMSYFTNPNY